MLCVLQGRRGRVLLGAVGLFFLGMAVMQAWSGNGYWRGGGGPLAGRVATMAQTRQPHVIARLVANFGTFTAANAFAVNLAVWALLQDFGFFGGLARYRPEQHDPGHPAVLRRVGSGGRGASADGGT